MTISRIHIDIIKRIRKALRENYSSEEWGNFDKQILFEQIFQIFPKDYAIINIVNAGNSTVDILLYHSESNKYVIVEFKYNESKKNNNFLRATYNKKLYEIINTSRENVDALLFVIDNLLHIDTIFFLVQEQHGTYDIADLINREKYERNYKKLLNQGYQTKKISPAYYIGEDEIDEGFIKQIKIKNYKFFSDERTFCFNDRFSVLIGDNSSGKTSLLDAVRASLKSLLSNMGNKRLDKAHGYGKSKNLRYISNKRKIELDSTPIVRLSDVHQNIQENSHPTELQCYIQAINDWTEWNHEKKAGKARFRRAKSVQAIDYAMDLYELANEVNNIQVVLPMFAYYGIHRTYDKHNKFPKLTLTRTDGYTNCLDAQTSYSFFKEWFRSFEHSPHILRCFKETILKCLKSEHIIDIEYRQEIIVDGQALRLDDFILTRKIENIEEHILMNNLSAGYKIVCSMVADMAYRCLQLNTPLNDDDNPIERTYGLVLIDELDMHLHPLWQRHIVNDLMLCFPRIQFITTTHSPFIVQSLKKEQIIALNEVKITKNPSESNIDTSIRFMGVENMYGKDFNDQTTLARQFYSLLRQKDVDPAEIRRVHAEYQQRYGDDAVLLARMNLMETITYERICHETD